MRSIILIFLMLFAGRLSSQTLQDYLKIAAGNNPAIKARQVEFQAALQKLPQAGAMPDPQVNASFFLRPMMLPMGNQLGSISVMQMFPWFGALDAMENQAVQMAEVKRQDVEVGRNELFLKVKNAWYPLFELEAQIRVQQELLRVLETDKELATAKFQQGRAPMVDAIRADIMIDEVKTGIALLEQKRRPLEVVFNRLLNRPDSLPVNTAAGPELMKQPLLQSGSGISGNRDSLVAGNPALAVFDQRIRAAQTEEKAAGYQGKPVISAGLQYMPLVKRNNPDLHLPPNTGRDMLMPMISLTVPIWKKKYSAAVEENRLMQIVYADQKKEMENELAARYEMTVYELERFRQTDELLNLQMTKTQQAVDLLMAAYSNSGDGFEEILRLQRQLYSYRMEDISARTQYQLALVRLDYLTGNDRLNN